VFERIRMSLDRFTEVTQNAYLTKGHIDKRDTLTKRIQCALMDLSPCGSSCKNGLITLIRQHEIMLERMLRDLAIKQFTQGLSISEKIQIYKDIDFIQNDLNNITLIREGLVQFAQQRDFCTKANCS